MLLLPLLLREALMGLEMESRKGAGLVGLQRSRPANEAENGTGSSVQSATSVSFGQDCCCKEGARKAKARDPLDVLPLLLLLLMLLLLLLLQGEPLAPPLRPLPSVLAEDDTARVIIRRPFLVLLQVSLAVDLFSLVGSTVLI